MYTDPTNVSPCLNEDEVVSYYSCPYCARRYIFTYPDARKFEGCDSCGSQKSIEGYGANTRKNLARIPSRSIHRG
jgi:hypothetical protein